MSSTSEKRSEAGRKGEEAEHSERGLAAADEETRERVAKAGGEAEHSERGWQAADEQTREELQGQEARRHMRSEVFRQLTRRLGTGSQRPAAKPEAKTRKAFLRQAAKAESTRYPILYLSS